MIYDANNFMPRCTVYDVDAKERIDRVVAVNAKAGWVQVAEQPLRVTEHDHIATRRVRFASIYPIKGGEHWPVLFHCYGRKRTMADVVKQHRDRKSTRLNSSHIPLSRMPSSA